MGFDLDSCVTNRIARASAWQLSVSGKYVNSGGDFVHCHRDRDNAAMTRKDSDPPLWDA
jgi:hypothetical protein